MSNSVRRAAGLRSVSNINWPSAQVKRALAVSCAGFLLCICSCANAQTQGPAVKSQPTYEQCKTLAAGTDAAIAKSIASLKDKDAQIRAQSALQIGKSCDARAVDPLIDLLKDAEPPVRIAAVEALGRLGSPDSAEDLINTIGDPDWRVRLALVGALASFKTFRARNMVLNGIANPSEADISNPDDMRVRCAAILTCNQLADVSFSRKAVLFLYNFLQSKHEPIRELARQTMFELKNTRNGPSEFAGILKQSNDPVLRRWAAEWMGRIGLEYGRTALEEAAANDADPAVKRMAAESLKALNSAP
jgi:HEAT repeat protein